MVAGGGASVIYADTVGDLGYAHELGNYAGADVSLLSITMYFLFSTKSARNGRAFSQHPENLHICSHTAETGNGKQCAQPGFLIFECTAEYSGGPSTQETYLYARTLLDCATANPDGKGRALICGGGIANFTDVAATFKGIITVGGWMAGEGLVFAAVVVCCDRCQEVHSNGLLREPSRWVCCLLQLPFSMSAVFAARRNLHNQESS